LPTMISLGEIASIDTRCWSWTIGRFAS
jgi:hypothetical protein